MKYMCKHMCMPVYMFMGECFSKRTFKQLSPNLSSPNWYIYTLLSKKTTSFAPLSPNKCGHWTPGTSSLTKAQPPYRCREKAAQTHSSQRHLIGENVDRSNRIIPFRPPHQQVHSFLKRKSWRRELSTVCRTCFFLSWGKTCPTLAFTAHKLSTYFSLMAQISVWLVYAPTHPLRLKRAKFTKH